MKLIRIQASSFEMGSVFGGRRSNEKAIRTVRLRDFCLGETEVTQGQWGAIMGSNPSPFKKGRNHPVGHVRWNDALWFRGQLSEIHPGKHFRLPIEAEWEYECPGVRA